VVTGGGTATASRQSPPESGVLLPEARDGQSGGTGAPIVAPLSYIFLFKLCFLFMELAWLNLLLRKINKICKNPKDYIIKRVEN